MNQKVLKIITVLMLIATLTMANFVLLCADVVSYAIDAVNTEKSTNHEADGNGVKYSTLDQVDGKIADIKLYKGTDYSEGLTKSYNEIKAALEKVAPDADISAIPYTAVTTWSANGTALEKDAKFAGETVYTATTVYTARSGFKFTDISKPSVDDATVTIAADGKTMTVTKTFPKTAKIVCSCVVGEITGVADQTIDLGVADSKTVTLSAKAQVTGDCKVEGHDGTVNYTYTVTDAGTTGATVKDNAVTVTAAGTAKVKVTATLASDATKTSTKEITLTVTTNKASAQDKADLAAAINAVKDIKEADYTEESYAPLKNALAKANTLKDKTDVSKTEIEDAIKAISDAKKGLKTKVAAKKEELNSLLTAVYDDLMANGNKYTVASYNNAVTVYKAVKDLPGKDGVTVAELEKAIKDLNDAKDALVLQEKADLEKEVALRNQKIQQAENKLKQRELMLNQKQEEVQRKRTEAEAIKENLEAQIVIIDKKKDELDKLQMQEREKLEALSGLSAEEAKERLIESLKEEAKTQAASYINDIMDDAKLTANKEAKRIVIQSIQRVATETAIENSVTVFHIESDEIKGRIIGREGRNIRALEAATGVEIVVDDTPEAIVLSAFDPVRREIARLALHQLVTDGRIHPARIEEVVAKVRKQVEEEIIETGKRTTIDLGIHGLHPELIRIIGKMKYRSSYGQNLLQHARETANLCAVMASELGLNPKKAKRAGLLHDIGKVPDEEPELPHALLGMKIAEKYKEKPDICNAIGAHHDETEMTSLLAPIVQVCDAISGARPGARREIVEAYIKRLNDLEQLAMSYPGVTKTYAIQAGRELRVIVGADKIDDKQTESLSGEIAKKIQDEMTYPGQVKITVIRETRAVSFAK